MFKSEDREVRQELLRASRRLLPAPRQVRLSHGRTAGRSRPPARSAQGPAADGRPARDLLATLLLRETTPFALARELPSALAGFLPGEAAPALLARIAQPRGGLDRFRSLRALNQLRSAHPGLSLDGGRLAEALDDRARCGQQGSRAPHRWRATLGRGRRKSSGSTAPRAPPGQGDPRPGAALPHPRPPPSRSPAGAGVPGHPVRQPRTAGDCEGGARGAAPGSLARPDPPASRGTRLGPVDCPLSAPSPAHRRGLRDHPVAATERGGPVARATAGTRSPLVFRLVRRNRRSLLPCSRSPDD